MHGSWHIDNLISRRVSTTILDVLRGGRHGHNDRVFTQGLLLDEHRHIIDLIVGPRNRRSPPVSSLPTRRPFFEIQDLLVDLRQPILQRHTETKSNSAKQVCLPLHQQQKLFINHLQYLKHHEPISESGNNTNLDPHASGTPPKPQKNPSEDTCWSHGRCAVSAGMQLQLAQVSSVVRRNTRRPCLVMFVPLDACVKKERNTCELTGQPPISHGLFRPPLHIMDPTGRVGPTAARAPNWSTPWLVLVRLDIWQQPSHAAITSRSRLQTRGAWLVVSVQDPLHLTKTVLVSRSPSPVPLPRSTSEPQCGGAGSLRNWVCC